VADQFTLVLQVQGTEQLVQLQGLIKGMGDAGETAERKLKETAAQTRAITRGLAGVAASFKDAMGPLERQVATLSAQIETLGAALTKATAKRSGAGAGASADLQNIDKDAEKARVTVAKLAKEKQGLYENYIQRGTGIMSSPQFADPGTAFSALRTSQMYGLKPTGDDQYLLNLGNAQLKAEAEHRKLIEANEKYRQGLMLQSAITNKQIAEKQGALEREQAEQTMLYRLRLQLNAMDAEKAAREKAQADALAQAAANEKYLRGLRETSLRWEEEAAEKLQRQKVGDERYLRGVRETSMRWEEQAAERAQAEKLTAERYLRGVRETSIRWEEQAAERLAAKATSDANYLRRLKETSLRWEEEANDKIARKKREDEEYLRRLRETSIRWEERAKEEQSSRDRARLMRDVDFQMASRNSQLDRSNRARLFMEGGGSRDDAVGVFGTLAVQTASNAAMLKALDLEVNKHTGSVNAAGRAYDYLHTGLRGAAGAMGAIWLTWGRPMAALWAGFAGVAAIREATKQYVEFEDQLARIRGIAEVTSAEVAKVAESAIRLGRGGLYSPTEIVQGTRTLAQAGLSVPEATSQTSSVLRFATAGEMQVPAAAQSLIGIASAFGRSSTDLSAVADAIAKGAAISQTTIENMTSAIRVSSVVAEQYGAKLDDVSGILAHLAQRNIEATTAGTALRNAYNEVYAPTEKARRVMQQLGLTAYEAGTGKMKPFLQVMTELREAVKDFDKESQNRAFATLFGERGGKVASALLTDLEGAADRIDDISKAAGYVNSASLIIESSIKGRAIGAVNSLRAAFVEAGQASQGAFSIVIAQLSRVAESEGLQSLLESLASAFAGLATAVMKSAEALGVLLVAYIGGKAVSMVGTFTTTIATLIARYGALNLAISATNLAMAGKAVTLEAVQVGATRVGVATGAAALSTGALGTAAAGATASMGGLAVATAGMLRVLGGLMTVFATVGTIIWAAAAAWDAYKSKQNEALRGLEEAGMDFDKRLAKRLGEERNKYEANFAAFMAGKAKPTDLETAFKQRKRDEETLFAMRVEAINADPYMKEQSKKQRIDLERRLTDQKLAQLDAVVLEVQAYERGNRELAEGFELRAKQALAMRTGDKKLSEDENRGRSYVTPLATEQSNIKAFYEDQMREIAKREDQKLKLLELKRREGLIGEEDYDREYDTLMERRTQETLRYALEFRDSILPQFQSDRLKDIAKRHSGDAQAMSDQIKAAGAEFFQLYADANRAISGAGFDLDNFYAEKGIKTEGRERKKEAGMEGVIESSEGRNKALDTGRDTTIENLEDSLGMREQIRALRTGLATMSTFEREHEERNYRVTKEYTKLKNEARAQGFDDYLADLEQSERRMLAMSKQLAEEQLKASLDPIQGMRSGALKVLSDLENVAARTEEVFTNAFKSAEDALVNFVRTGKMDFRSLVDSIIADMARMAIQQEITKPLMKGIMGILNGLGGGGVSSIDAVIAKGGGFVSNGMGGFAPTLHSGGIVGSAGAMRSVDMSIFNGAQRYHTGGQILQADEVPIIARKGERMLTEAQNREYERPSAGVNIVQHITVGSQVSRGDVITAMTASKNAAKREMSESLRRGRSGFR
jgi:TP901 family phage tail tape measure protein